MATSNRTLSEIPLTSPDEWAFKSRMIRMLIIFAVPISVYYIIADLRRGLTGSAASGLGFLVLFVIALLMLRRQNERTRKIEYTIIARVFFLLMTAFHVYALGLAKSFGIIPQMALFPFLAILIVGRREGLVWVGLYLVAVGGSAAYQVFAGDPVVDRVTLLLSSLAIYALVSVDIFMVETVRQRGYSKLIENQRQLEESNEKLRTAILQAQAASTAKSEFLANMTHEFRTPLNHIIGFTELMQGGRAGPVTENQREYLTDVISSSRHLLSLITDVLDMAKVEAGKLEVSVASVEVPEFIEDTMRLVREEASAKSISLRVEVEPGAPAVSADQQKLRQIMLNLLSNALKFTPAKGEVAVRVAGDDTGFVRFSVSDSGIGIDPARGDQVFEPFEQIPSPGSSRHGGTGLGLAICRTLVELHGGQIWFKSAGHGKGSTFHFTIPVMDSRTDAWV